MFLLELKGMSLFLLLYRYLLYVISIIWNLIWVTLPQGMKNSPTLCQKFVAQALQEVRQEFKEAYTIHG